MGEERTHVGFTKMSCTKYPPASAGVDLKNKSMGFCFFCLQKKNTTRPEGPITLKKKEQKKEKGAEDGTAQQN